MRSGPRESSVGWTPAQDPGGIVEVDLAQDLLRKADAVDLPAPLDGGGAVDLTVERLEIAPGLGEEANLVLAGRGRGAVRAVHHVLLVGADAAAGPEQDAGGFVTEERV